MGAGLTPKRMRASLDATIEFWLGLEYAPTDVGRTDQTWTPDDPSVYCHRCGESIGPHEATSTGCGSCRTRKIAFDRCVRLGKYEGELREWVHALKFHRRWEVGRSLGSMLGQALISPDDCWTGRAATVIPMPMPWSRRMYRGIDHARVIAAAIAHVTGGSICQPLTHRNGPPQITLTATERRRAASRLLALKNSAGWWGRISVPPIAGSNVVLVDDVRTTGGTLDSAAKLLRRLGPKSITAAVIAVADAPGRTGRSSDVEARIAGPETSDRAEIARLHAM